MTRMAGGGNGFAMREVVLDTETTGLDPLETAIASSDRLPTGQKFRRYVCAERAMPADALAVHGFGRVLGR